MADEEKKASEPQKAEKTESIEDLTDDLAALQEKAEKDGKEVEASGKPGLFGNKMMLLIVGLGGLVVVLSLTLVVVMFVMKDDAATDVPAEPAQTEAAAEHHEDTPAAEEAAAETKDPHEAEMEALVAEQDDALIPQLTEEEMAALDAMTSPGSGESVGEDRGTQMTKIMDHLADIKLDSAEIAAALGEEVESFNPAQKARQDSIRIMEWIKKQKAEIASRASDLDQRENELKQLERSVDKKITRIEQVESTRTGNLARLYDGMDAKAVANLMANLDDETVLAILPRMNTKNASAVLSLMPPRRAAVLSKALITLSED